MIFLCIFAAVFNDEKCHDETHGGAQIDLLIDRADQTVNICEMKFARSEYEVTKADDEDFNHKMDVFLQQTDTKKSLMLTLITTFGVAKNKYSGTVQRQITLADLFK